MDLLDRLLGLMPIQGALDLRCEFGAPWQLYRPAVEAHEIAYHILLRGTSVIEDGAGAPIHMRAGDIVLFPSGVGHQMRDGSGREANANTRTPEGSHEFVTNHSLGPQTNLLCGRFLIPVASRRLLRDMLPGRLLVHSAVSSTGEAETPSTVPPANRLVRIIELMREESLERGPGSGVLVDHLSAALFGLTLRLAGQGEAAGVSILALAQHPRLQAALVGMFDNPGHAWTQDELADLCHMSRATFARHFTEALGQSAADLLFEIRMAIASRKLAQTVETVAGIGLEVGYQSDAAFQRAFKKHTGLTPAQWRTQAHVESLAARR